MSLSYAIIEKNNLNPTVWDGGETFEYFIYPENSSYTNRDFLFRISAATINKVPSTFTRFNNYNRFLVMLNNNLKINNNGNQEYYTTNDVFKFDSNSDIISYTKGNDFNLMVSKNIKAADVFFLNDAVQLSQTFIFLFAKTLTVVSVNKKEFYLEPDTLLIFENSEQEVIDINTNQTIIAGYLVF